MGNFSIKEDLLKLKGAFITNFKGRTETKRCLVIPVDDSGLYVGEKGVYLNLTAIEMENPQFKETHCIKQSLVRRTEASPPNNRRHETTCEESRPTDERQLNL